LTIAPNMVTLIGFFYIILSYLVSLYYSPRFSGDCPPWVYLVHASCLFMYQTMDALDGKQARRTGSSSPLGELFDHGCDALSLAFIALTVAGSLQMGATWTLFWVLTANCVTFYMAQWEEYHTGTLELWYLNVTEAQLLIMLIHLMTAALGSHFWLQTVVVAGVALQYNWIVVGFQLVGAGITVLGNIQKILSKEGLNLTVFSRLIPMIMCVALFAVWGEYSPIHVVHTHPHWFLLALGFMTSNLVGRVVVARVCKEPFSWFQPLLLPLLFGAANAYLNEMFVEEKYYVVGFSLFLMAAYLHFALWVIDAMCGYLGIKCLSIKKPNTLKRSS